jgi:outer membrane protein assembly factor BamB
MRTRLSGIALVLALVAAPAAADDWPQFRGPKRDGVSTEKGLLTSWPKEGPKLAWSFNNAGLGYSSFAIAGGKVYTIGTRDKDEIVLCLDAATGTELWIAKVGPIFTFPDNAWGDGPRSTPTIDGSHLYALGGQGELVCLNISGKAPKELWRKNMVKDLGGELMFHANSWGYCESPLVDGKLLVCTPGGAKGTLAALDKMTGAVIWRSTKLTQAAPYSSIMPADINGERQYVQASYDNNRPAGYLNGVAAKDGKALWSQKIVASEIFNIASPPIVQGNLVYATTYEGCHLFEIGPGNKAKEKYKPAGQKVMKVNHGGAVLVGDSVYGYGSTRGWVCQDFTTGKRTWDESDFDGQKSGSTIAASGMLYLYTDRGEVGLAKADPAAFSLLSSFTIKPRSKLQKSRPTSRDSGVWAYPAIANGYLYLRDAELVFCYDIRGKK